MLIIEPESFWLAFHPNARLTWAKDDASIIYLADHGVSLKICQCSMPTIDNEGTASILQFYLIIILQFYLIIILLTKYIIPVLISQTSRVTVVLIFTHIAIIPAIAN